MTGLTPRRFAASGLFTFSVPVVLGLDIRALSMRVVTKEIAPGGEIAHGGQLCVIIFRLGNLSQLLNTYHSNCPLNKPSSIIFERFAI